MTKEKHKKKDAVYIRSSNYRKIYLKYNKGIFHKYYLCAYCKKKLLAKEIMQVDHIIAVNAVKKNIFLQLLFKLCGTTVNTHLNLAAACRDCNLKKSDHTGKWIPQGIRGSIMHSLLQSLTNNFQDLFVKYWIIVIVLILIPLTIGLYSILKFI